MTLTNQDLARIFDELATGLALEGANSFKVSTHRRVARILRALPRDLATLERPLLEAQLADAEGIGRGAQRRILEILDRGALAEHHELLTRVPRGLFEVLGLPGLGPKAVRTLWIELGIESLEDLRQHLDSDRIAGLPGLGHQTVLHLRESIHWAAQEAKRTPLGVALPLAEQLVGDLQALPGIERVAAAGALRRGCDRVTHVDVLVACEDPEAVARRFAEQSGGVAAAEGAGPKVTLRLASTSAGGRPLRVDLRMAEPSSWGAAWISSTGPAEHLEALRDRAQARGLELASTGLRRDGTPLGASQSETTVYEALDLPWIAPELRDRIDLDAPPSGPFVREEDLRAELHSHTTASDGRHDLDDLIRLARARGYEALAITEHSPSSAIAGGLSVEDLQRHAEQVRAANARHDDIRVLAGTEVDILADGELDYPDEVLQSLDLVVASPHAALQQTPEQATRRLLAAIRNPHVDIVGHPTGRIVGRRPGLDPDLPALAKAGAETRTALEINANWRRLDLSDAAAAVAVEHGCLLAINTDAHKDADFDHLRYGALTARRALLPQEQCINTWPLERLEEWLARDASPRA